MRGLAARFMALLLRSHLVMNCMKAMLFGRWDAGHSWGLVLILALFHPVGAVAADPPSNPSEAARVRLEPDEKERVAVWIDGVRITTFQHLQQAGGTLLTNCVSLRLADDRHTVVVGGTCRPVQLAAGPIDGWSAQIPAGSELVLKADFQRNMLEVRAVAANRYPVVLGFIDGATLSLPAGAAGLVDVLLDRTYVFTSHPSPGSAPITGRDGAQQNVSLTEFSLPMTGGPWVENTGGGAAGSRTRLSPTVPVQVSGVVGGTLTIRAGEQTVTLGTTGAQTISLPNGASVNLRQSTVTRTLNWQVDKGDFRVSLAGVSGWQAVGSAGAGAAMAWNVTSQPPSQAVDITNTTRASGSTALLVNLPEQVVARVASGATFQYATEANARNFQAAGFGGAVVLLNTATGQTVNVSEGSMAFVNGRPLVRGASLGQNNSVTVAWKANQTADVGGSVGQESLSVGSLRVLRTSEGGVLKVGNQAGVGLILQAVSGSFSISTDGLRGGAVTLTEGTVLQLVYDAASGVLTATPRRGAVTVAAADGTAQSLSLGMRMTVVGGRMTTASARPESDLIYFSNLNVSLLDPLTGFDLGKAGDSDLAAGAGAGGTVNGALTGSGLNNSLDASRILQAPESATGRP